MINYLWVKLRVETLRSSSSRCKRLVYNSELQVVCYRCMTVRRSLHRFGVLGPSTCTCIHSDTAQMLKGTGHLAYLDPFAHGLQI